MSLFVKIMLVWVILAVGVFGWALYSNTINTSYNATVIKSNTYSGLTSITSEGFGGSVGNVADVIYYNTTLLLSNNHTLSIVLGCNLYPVGAALTVQYYPYRNVGGYHYYIPNLPEGCSDSSGFN